MRRSACKDEAANLIGDHSG